MCCSHDSCHIAEVTSAEPHPSTSTGDSTTIVANKEEERRRNAFATNNNNIKQEKHNI